MLIKRPEFDFTDKWESNPGLLEADLFSRLIGQASDFGEFTVEIVKHAWLNHLYRAESEIQGLLHDGYRISEKRLEAACKRTIFYDYTSTAMVKKVLIERLDLLALDHSTDIYGQYTLF
jgi:hypothetical protein